MNAVSSEKNFRFLLHEVFHVPLELIDTLVIVDRPEG